MWRPSGTRVRPHPRPPDGGLGDLLGRLVKAGVDDLEARVAERAGHDFRAAVVPVQARLRDDHSVRFAIERSV